MKLARRMAIRPAHLALLVVLVTIGVAACGGSSTPPGASKVLGSSEQGGYLFLRWQEGLDVMIWHDLVGEGTAHSAGFATGRLYIERGSARFADGRSLAWEVQTADGRMGEVQIGGVRYDLAGGTLFIVTTQGGTPTVRQLSRDLSDVPLDHDGILAFARNDPDLAAFLNNIPPATPPTATLTATPTRPATPPQINLEAVLQVPTTLPDGGSVELEFTLINNSESGLYVLKWYTPLEGIAGEIFYVERDGQPIPYEGLLATRGDPPPDAYVFLDSGASVSASVDLAAAYDFSEPGEYTIAFISPRISHVARTEDQMAASVEELGPVQIPSNSVTVRIEGYRQ
jgi:peptidyl-Lys metalloendopeptidase